MTETSRDDAGLTDEQAAALNRTLTRKMRELAPNASQGTRDYRDIERSLTDWLMYRLQGAAAER